MRNQNLHFLFLLFLLKPFELHAEAPVVAGDDLDQRVTEVFRSKCSVCHDGLPGNAASDVDYLLDLLKVTEEYIDEDDRAASYLLEIIETGSMPKEKWKEGIEWEGPLDDGEKSDVISWISRGGVSQLYRHQAEVARQAAQRTKIRESSIVRQIAMDLGRLKGAELANARYLTLTNLHNMQSVSNDNLELFRQALVKMLNSLSRSSDVLGTDRVDVSSTVNRVVAVDEERTIFRFDLRHLGWNADDWESIVKHYPYGLVHRSGIGKTVYTLTTSEYPYMRADWFVFATSQPPLYHQLVGIPRSLDELDRRLGVDRPRNIRDRKVQRAGFAISKVSVNNRLIERHTFPGGYYYLSYDFGSNDGKANFFENPFGPVNATASEKAFVHDGGELIYRMPNGFQAYALVKANGERLSIAPSAIVHDDSMPGGKIINGISCLSCHFDGMKPENSKKAASLDEVRISVLSDPRRFTFKERDLAEELFPQAVVYGRLMDADRRSFRAAMAAAGITKVGATEPVRALFDLFAQNLNLETAAAAFGVPEDEFAGLLNRENVTRTLRTRLKSGGVQRQLYVEEFRRISRFTGLGEPRDFTPLPLPYFGNDPEAVAANPIPESAPPQRQPVTHVQSARIEILDADNTVGALKVTVSSGDDRNSFSEGQVIPCVIKANEDCFVTVLGIDHKDNVTVLAPNKWHPQLTLKGGRSMRIPTPEMGFEFFAEPPHGSTRIRVIATKTPLRIQGVDAETLRQSKSGFVSLGNRKGIGARGIGARPRIEQARLPLPVNKPQAPSDVDLARQFAPNEWATARWTFTTRP